MAKLNTYIQPGLGIPAVQTTESVWRYVPVGSRIGAQIDLHIDRSDHSINICEMKFADTQYTVSKDYAADLKRKRYVFKQ